MDLAQPSDDRQNDLVPTVLSLMATHITDPRTMCSLLQLNTSCRAALQQSTGRVSIASLPSVAALRGLSAWLPAHAGLVHELGVHLQQKERWKEKQAFHEAVLDALRPALRQSARATPPRLPLRLARAKGVSLPSAFLACLPTTLTSLDLDPEPTSSTRTDTLLNPAIQRLAGNLRHLRLRCPYDWWGFEDMYNVENRRATRLAAFTQLTRIDLDLVLSGEMSHLPPSLVEVKVHMKVDAKETPWLETSDGDEENPKYKDSLQASLHVHLAHLSRLQRCELRAACNQDAVTLHLSAPHLTRLQLDGNFVEVTGLEPAAGQHSRMKELWLRGTSMNIGRLVALMARMPELQDFLYMGCSNWDNPDEGWDWIQDSERVTATLQEVRDLGAVLGAATQLTSLCVSDLEVDCDSGAGDDDGSRSDGDDEAERGVSYGWGQHLRGLTRLRKLDFDHCIRMSRADMLQLSTLTALTFLCVWGFDSDACADAEDVWKEVRGHLPLLKHYDGIRRVDLSW